MIERIIKITLGVVLIATLAVGALVWFTFRVYVPPDSCAVLVRKMGRALGDGQMVATESGQRGIQQEVLGPGRYFYNPIWWDYEIKPLLTIPAGDPKSWEWIHSLDNRQRDELRAGTFRFKGEFPKIGVVTRKVGTPPPVGQTVVSRASGMRGVLAEVLTPGTYKINPYLFEVEIQQAVVIAAGFVGVVTNLFGTQPETTETPMLPDMSWIEPGTVPSEGTLETGAVKPEGPLVSFARPLAKPGQRGTLRDVLQPGVYFINPKLQKVTVVEIGFNEYSQVLSSKTDNQSISFPSDTGFLIQLGVTVVWGIDPRHAAETINEFGNVDAVMDKVIGPQLRSICRNIGSNYAARDFIQGEKREKFQHDLTAELKRVCRAKNIEVRLALVRELEVHAPAGTGGGEVTEDLKRTIQQSYVAIEQQITKAKQREAASVKAQLEQERKKVDIAREGIKGETGVLVAGTLAEGQKQAAQIDAQADLEVATIMQQAAELEAKRTEILGRAHADVERMKNDAEAKGYELLVNAFGGGQAYNLYTFAENFKPESIRLFFAGEGTFWTDLTRFQELGAATQLRQAAAAPEQ